MTDYFKFYFETLASGLKSVNEISLFTKNTEIVGQFAEKIITDFLNKIIPPLQLSTGTVICEETFTKQTLNQIDGIFWSPNPLPPIFSIDNFGLIPKNSVFGIIEIKKTDYSEGLKNIDKLFSEKDNYLPKYSNNNYFAIICVNSNYDPNGDNEYTNLRKKYPNKIICLLDFYKKEKIIVNHEDLKILVNEIGKMKYSFSKKKNKFLLK